jgi:hypothetical protein
LDPRQVVASDLKLAIIDHRVVLQDVQDDLKRFAHRQRIHISNEFGLCTAQSSKRLPFALPLDQSATPQRQYALATTKSLWGM